MEFQVGLAGIDSRLANPEASANIRPHMLRIRGIHADPSAQ
jgi:hypothetical protein